MLRVTQQSQQNQAISSIQRNFKEMEMSQRRLGSGVRVQFPHQNVGSVVNSIYYRTRLSAIDRFQENIVSGKERLSVVHDSLGSVTQALNRARELTVQGANGTYNREDRLIMAKEMEELIERIYDVSLTKSKGEYVFSGTSVKTEPFRAHYSQNKDLGSPVISAINYEGDANIQNREVENSRYVNVGSPGNYTFWASNSSVMSNTDSSNYIAREDQTIMIDSTVINIKEGDNLDTIADRINSVGGSVLASVMPLRDGGRGLSLETNNPHKIMLQDLEGGTALVDLGLVREGLGNSPENNYSPTAVVGGKSVFEAMMFVRDAMINDDLSAIGGAGLGLIDSAIDNVVANQAEASSKVSRLDMGNEGFINQKYALTEALSKNEDVDYAEEIINFNTWQYAHNASLQTAGKLLGRTLMDYLR